MPNWCSNILTITSDEGVISEDIALAILNSEEELTEGDESNVISFAKSFPIPAPFLNDGRWYDWCVKNWGTKWDASYGSIIENSSTVFSATFDTAWSPPEGWVKFFSQVHPEVTVKCDFMETGNSFVGYFVYKNGAVVDEEERGEITKEDYERFGYDAEDFEADYE